MKYDADSVDEYIDKLPEERKEIISKLRELILENLPEGFEETLSYGMIGYVVPHSIYPEGYHVNHDEPLPFMALASQKNHIALYHSGIYIVPEIEEWFREEYSKRVDTKLDMGKSCIRFKNPKKIPFDLLEDLFGKINVDEYVKYYENSIKKK
ncbi:DUF1801 domain-containing protein [Gudongella sp. DL1XJH-153]|uniref:DUF1801 domain-containing protein n=1 Tax=Gudongella sp. DL1XJH-153 TaxID=3409804 RepID=UPI003BB75B29